MRYKIIFLLSLFGLVMTVGVSAKNDERATRILDQVAATYEKSNGISATFTFEIRDGVSKRVDKFDGQLKMRGKKFYLDTPDISTWFDGITQWAMLKSADEINISTPSDEELQAVNPYILLKLYKNGFNCRYIGESTINNSPVSEIELTPTDTRNELKKIVLKISKDKLYPLTIELFNKNNTSNTIRVSKYKTGMNHPNQLFVFDKQQYGSIDVIDLR